MQPVLIFLWRVSGRIAPSFFFPITTSLSPLPSFPIFSRRVTKRSSNEKRDSKSFLFPLARTFYLILPSSVGYFYPREVRVKWMFPGIKSSSRSRALWLFHLSSYVTSAHGEKRRCNDGGVATVLLSPGNECGPRRIDTVYIVLPSSEISCERVFVVVGRKNSRVTDNRYPPRLFPSTFVDENPRLKNEENGFGSFLPIYRFSLDFNNKLI